MTSTQWNKSYNQGDRAEVRQSAFERALAAVESRTRDFVFPDLDSWRAAVRRRGLSAHNVLATEVMTANMATRHQLTRVWVAVAPDESYPYYGNFIRSASFGSVGCISDTPLTDFRSMYQRRN